MGLLGPDHDIVPESRGVDPSARHGQALGHGEPGCIHGQPGAPSHHAPTMQRSHGLQRERTIVCSEGGRVPPEPRLLMAA